ncbi:Retrovirus-related Pol polyprotein from transposon TNT 1-94 [Ceratobasidium sp. AG-Ba]|nr:Retrovirus-related Pol polyprotein from transposon TNT 1-94 [Ceratobasidium sp. AG-Ba]
MSPSDTSTSPPPASSETPEITVSVGSGVYKINKLTGQDNYIVWRMRMVDILVDCGLYDYVDGTKPKPGTSDAKWTSNDQKALSAICLRCSDAISECWDHLNSLYKSSSLLGLLSARNRFYRMVMRDDQSLEDHMRELCIAMDELTVLGETLNELDYALQVIGSLPSGWQSFIGTISWRVDRTKKEESDIYASDLLARLMDEERRKQGAMTGSEVVMYSRSSPNRSGSSKPDKCNNCGKKAHFIADCWAKGGGAYKPGVNQRRRGGRAKGKNDKSNAVVKMACMAYSGSIPAGAWLLDSGSLTHVVSDKTLFLNYVATPDSQVGGIGGGAQIAGRGEVVVELFGSKGKRTTLRLKDVAYVPSAPHNLVSEGRMTDAGMKSITAGNASIICSSKRPAEPRQEVTLVVRTWDKWHRALGHTSMESLRVMAKEGIVKGMELKGSAPQEHFCEACVQGKHKVTPFPAVSETKVEKVGDLTVSDVWGPASVAAIGGFKYYVSFTDVATRFTTLYLMRNKTEVLDRYKDYEAFIANLHSRKLRIVQFDNGQEYLNAPLLAHIASQGTSFETTAPHSSAQNGIAERLNQTIADRGRAMRLAAQLPKYLWVEAFCHACYLKNCTYTCSLVEKKTPYELMYGVKPNVSTLREFRSPCWVLDQSGKNTKLDAKSHKRTFVGIDVGGKAWRYWSHEQQMVLVSRNVKFPPTPEATEPDNDKPTACVPVEGEKEPESEFDPESEAESEPAPAPAKAEPTVIVKTTPETPSAPTKVAAPPPLPAIVERSRRNLPPVPYDLAAKHGKTANPNARFDAYGPYVSDNSKREASNEAIEDYAHVVSEDATFDDAYSLLIVMDLAFDATNDSNDKPTYHVAMKGVDRELWREATELEVAQLKAAGTFVLVDLPAGKKAIKLAKGYSQVEGADYHLTFALVLRLDAFRCLCAIAAILDLDMTQLDVVGAYLNGKLEEEIYMEQIPGFSNSTLKVLRLLKTLYGLKQSGRVWNRRLHEALLSLEYMRLFSDSCVYRRLQREKLSILAFHVDDVAIFTSKGYSAHVKGELMGLFNMRDLGKLNHFVGFRITRNQSKRTVTLSQDASIKSIAKRAGMENCRSTHTPMSRTTVLDRYTGKSPDYAYSTMIGALMYAALGTRPDLTYAVQHLAQFSTCYGPEHITALKRVLRYAISAADRSITYDGLADDGKILEVGYVDANWGLDILDR